MELRMINRKTIISVLATLLFLSPLALSAEEVSSTDQIKIEVAGMVCAFCAQGIKSGLSKHSSIENTDVSLAEKLVTITLKQGMQIKDEEITEIITNSGYNVVEINRSEQADKDA